LFIWFRREWNAFHKQDTIALTQCPLVFINNRSHQSSKSFDPIAFKGSRLPDSLDAKTCFWCAQCLQPLPVLKSTTGGARTPTMTASAM
jgi:hypothetical protein